MAQAGYTPIQLYVSTSAGVAPSAGNLANGELAINITDGKLYYKDNGGVVQVLATKGAGTIGGSTTQVQYNNAGALAGSSNLTFDGTTLTAAGLAGPHNGTVGATTPNTGAFTTLAASGAVTLLGGTANGVAYLNGSKVLTTGSALTFDGTNLAVVGSSSGTGGGAFSAVRNGASYVIALGNKSALLGGAYDATPNIYYQSSALAFYDANAGSERMRLDSSGNLLVGTSSQARSGGVGVQAVSSDQSQFVCRNSSATAGKYYQMGVNSANALIIYNNSNTGVFLLDNSTTWGQNSDERQKTPLIPFVNPLEKVCTLRAGTGRYLTDEASVSRSFLIAQDVQKVLPEAVSEQPNRAGFLGLAYTDLIPLLTAAIQELKAEFDAYKATHP